MDSRQHTSSVALNTVELLEAILLNAPMIDVLLAQRVCQQWKATIQGSKKLQELLFFRARSAEYIPLYCYGSDGYLASGSHANPLLILDPPSLPFGICLGIAWPGIQPNDKAYSLVQPLPLVDPGARVYTPSWAYPTASWRKMHLGNPSPTHVAVSMNLILPSRLHRSIINPWPPSSLDLYLLHNPDGVRAGHILEMVFKLWKSRKGKIRASAHIPQFDGPSSSEVINAIRNTEAGQTTIAGFGLKLVRADRWQCDSSF